MEPVTLGCIILTVAALYYAMEVHIRLRSLKLNHRQLKADHQDIQSCLYDIFTQRIIAHLYKPEKSSPPPIPEDPDDKLGEKAYLEKQLQAEKEKQPQAEKAVWLYPKLEDLNNRLTETASLDKQLRAKQYYEIFVDAWKLWREVMIPHLGFRAPELTIPAIQDIETKNLYSEIIYALRFVGK